MATPKSKLTKSLVSMKKAGVGEQPRYQKLMRKAVRASSAASTSYGTVSASEKKAIHYATMAIRTITTQGEAYGTKKVLKRRARKS